MSGAGGDASVRIEPSIPVLFLGAHHGCLGIARSLGRLGIQVHGVGSDLEHPVFRSRYVRSAHAWDLINEPAQATVSFLLDLGRELAPDTLLIPTSDDTTRTVADHADALAERFVFPRQSPDLIANLTSKRENCRLAESAGVPVPAAEYPQSIEDVRRFCERADFPLMLKGIDGRKLFERTGLKMVIVGTPDELLERYAEMEDPAAPNLMLQEYIPGGDDTIWMFNGYFDAAGNCPLALTGRKLRQTPPHMGATSLGVCEPNPTVERMTIDFMQHIGYRGILDIGYRYDARDGRYKLLDPNPRIGSSFRLFVGDNGMDVARCLYLDMTGQPLPETRPRLGRKWVVEESDLDSFLIYRREGELGLFEWLRSFRGVQESAWFARDDPNPFWPIARSIIKRSTRLLGRTVLGLFSRRRPRTTGP